MNDAASIRRSVLTAVGWATGTRLVGQLANWAMTLAAFRFLHPEDYGLMALTITFSGVLHSVSSVGLVDAIIQKQQISDAQLRSIFGLILVINGTCLLVLFGLAYPVASVYQDPRLVGMVQASSLVFIATAFQAIPRAMLEKRLDFKTVSRIELVANVCGGAVLLVFAWAGIGPWALLIGMLFTNFGRLIGFACTVPYFPRPRLRVREVWDLLQNGAWRTGENLLWYCHANADIVIVGKLLGPHSLGIYSVARQLAGLPIDKLGIVIRPLAIPAFAQVQEDRAEALRYLQKALRLLGFLSFPVFLGIAATAPQITTVILGPHWQEAALPLTILAFATSIRPVGLIIPPFLMGIGDFVGSFKNTLFAAMLFPIAFFVGCHWGLIGVCISWVIVNPIQLFVLLRRVGIVCGAALGQLVKPLLS